MVMRHGIEELPLDKLCARVAEMMQNAEENGHPVWDWDVPKIMNDLVEYDDEMLAAHVLDLQHAVETALKSHSARVELTRQGQEIGDYNTDATAAVVED